MRVGRAESVSLKEHNRGREVCSRERGALPGRAAGLGHGSGGAGEESQFTGPFVLWMVRCADSYCVDKIPDKSHFWTFFVAHGLRGQPMGLGKAWRQELGASCVHPTLGIRERMLALPSFLSVLT